jgi:HlyD family secretion protein
MKKKSIIGGIGVLLAASIAWPLATRAFASTPDVTTDKVKRETLAITVTVSGKTEAAGTKDVFPPAAGTLKRVLVSEGQRVRRGQVLAQMDPKPLDAQVRGARAALSAADAQIDSIDAQMPSDADRDAADESVTTSRNIWQRSSKTVDELAEDYGRSKDATRAALKSALEGAKTQRDQAYVGYLNAKAGARKLDAASGGSQEAAASAQREQAKEDLEQALLNRSKAALRAPITGIVILNSPAATPGGDGPGPTDGCAVSPAWAPFTIAPAGSARFDAQADEADVARIREGQEAIVTLDAFPGQDFPTRVGSIKPTSVQTKTGGTAFPVLLPLERTGKDILFGMGGNAEIEVDAVKDALTIPAEALIEDQDSTYVFVVRGGKLRKVTVETGAMTDTRIQIARGLAEGDEVGVPTDTTALAEGMTVEAGGSR